MEEEIPVLAQFTIAWLTIGCRLWSVTRVVPGLASIAPPAALSGDECPFQSPTMGFQPMLP